MAQKSSGNVKLYKIAKLTPQPLYWKIKATIEIETKTEEQKNFRNKKGDGYRFAVLFRDDSAEIRGVAFGIMARELESEIENNKEYFVTGIRADLKKANKEYKSPHKYELKFNKGKPLIEPVDGSSQSLSQDSGISEAASVSSSGSSWNTEDADTRTFISTHCHSRRFSKYLNPQNLLIH
ncbi:uncharacterized protein LOC134277434 [Saccostrea cucullata]|uniref:uncharacterized protein LOC134277434 n=1 Tax=Saccostrea cuccullata TaxID=36930 RepID=UPI002ED6757C